MISAVSAGRSRHLASVSSWEAWGIGGIPLWSGYVSKTLLHESMVEYAKAVGEGAVLVNPGMASASAGIPGIVTSLLLNPGIWKAAEWVFLLTGGMTVPIC